MDEELNLVLLPQKQSVYYVEPCFRRDIKDTKSINQELERIFSENAFKNEEKYCFARALYKKLRMLEQTWKSCFELNGFGRLKHMGGVLYELKIQAGELNIRIIFIFAIYKKREIVVLLSAFHEKNKNMNSRESHKIADIKALERARQLKAEGIIDEIVCP